MFLIDSAQKNLLLNVSAPIGGFANHLRWLMILDSGFGVSYRELTKETYRANASPDWPKYHQFNNGFWMKQPGPLLEKMQNIFQTFSTRTVLDSLESKTKFISTQVYDISRTWHNWLIYEWRYREIVDSLINLNHKFVESWNDQTSKTILLTIDPNLAYRCYLKFNSNLNNTDSLIFFKDTDYVNKQNAELAQNNVNIKLMRADTLYQPMLNRDFYQEIIEWCNLEDHYDSANTLHQLWYQAHQRAEQEFVKDINNVYK